MSRVAITRAQADYLRALQSDATRAQEAFACAIQVVALAADSKGQIKYDFGAEPFVEVTPGEK